MADMPQPDSPDEIRLAEHDLPPQAVVVRPLIERTDVVWLVAGIALALIVLTFVSTRDLTSVPTEAAGEKPRFVTDINSAPATELALLPGVGPQLAERIVAERTTGGPFTSAEQLARVRGIGPKTIEQVTPLVICGPASAAASATDVVDLATGRPRAALLDDSASTSRAMQRPPRLTAPAQPAPAPVQNPVPSAVAGE